jgi:outer membrane protein TolC
MEHTTSLEHAMDLAQANLKQAKRLLDQGVKAREAGDIDDARLEQLQRLYDAANDDVVRVRREN